MKTAEEWLRTPGVVDYTGSPTVASIRAIQADALRHASDFVSDNGELKRIIAEAVKLEE